MAALTNPRTTPQRLNGQFGTIQSVAVKTATTIYVGAVVAVDNTGYALPAQAGTFMRAVVGVLGNSSFGRPGPTVVGAAGTTQSPTGSVLAQISLGEFHLDLDTSETPALNNGDIGKLVFMVDDHTVSRASSGGSGPRLAAGILREVTSGSSPQGTGAWVGLGAPPVAVPTGP